MRDDVTISLRRLPLWNNTLSLMGAMLVPFALNAVYEAAPTLWSSGSLDAGQWLTVITLVMLAAVWGLTIAQRAWVRRRPMAPIRLTDTGVTLPKSPESRREVTVAYGDIVAVGETGRAPRRLFFVESRGRIFALPEALFAEPTGPAELFVTLKEHLSAQPQGTSLLVHTERARLGTWRSMMVRPLVTQSILGVNAVFFLNTWLKGALDVPFGLLRWGANAPALVYRGEFYRLAAANFLHGHWLHVGMNLLALWYLGSLIERLLGWARFSLVYLLAGATAMAASAYTAGAVMTVGASGAIFGLLGSFAVISWRLRLVLPLGVRQTPRWWLTMFVVNTFIPLLWPVVDLTAHVAGFVTGASLTFALLGTRRVLPAPAGRPLQAVAALVIAVYTAALATAVARAATTTASQEVRFGQLLLADRRTAPQTLNTLAWLWMADPSSTQEHLQAARASAHEAALRMPELPEYQATLGMVCQRLRNAPCAIEAWRTATELAHEQAQLHGVVRPQAGLPALYAAQLARLLHQQAAERTPSPTAAQPAFAPALSRHRHVWQLTWEHPLTASQSVYLLGAGALGEPAALAHLTVPAEASSPYALPQDLGQALDDAGVRATTVAWQGDAPAPAPARDPNAWTLWRLAGDSDEEPQGP